MWKLVLVERRVKMTNLKQTLLMLSGESSIDPNLLAEDEALIEMILTGTDYAELLDYVNDNY
jgi:hypothetical protein